MNYSKKVCSFTGYRFQKLNQSLKCGGYDIESLKEKLKIEIDELISEDFQIFQCGMALGSDMLFAESVLEFKRFYPRIELYAIIPCLEQEKAWNEEQKEKYNEILKKAAEVKLISDKPYFNGCMQIRNRYLAKTCDMLLAVFDGKTGGTMNTIEYAKKFDKKIRIIDSSTLLRVTFCEHF